jgi:hypothetical protein
LRLFLQETIELWGKNEGVREGGMKELEMQGIDVVKPLIVCIKTQVWSIFVAELFFNGFEHVSHDILLVVIFFFYVILH